MRGKITRITNIVVAFVLMVGLISPLAYTQNATAAGEVFTTVANKTTGPNSTISLGDLQVDGISENEIVVIVRAPGGELEIDDSLVDVIGYGERLVISGLLSEVNAALATLTLQTYGLGVTTVTATLGDTVDGHLLVVDPDTGRGYMIVNDLYDEDTDELIEHRLNWFDARDAAETYVYQGATGYLATITSQAENDFIALNLDNNGWLGANDDDVEGEWRWVTGPEAGQQFWQSTDYDEDDEPQGGHAVGGMFNAWNEGEPNNQSGENCAEFIAGDGWNDLPCGDDEDSEHLNGYVVEFGDDENQLVPTASTSFTVTSEGATINVGNCAQLMALDDGNVYDTINLTADIDCTDQEVEPLFDGEYFYGTLEGNGHTISNVTIDQPWEWAVGLIARASGATIQNLTLDNFAITGSDGVSALIGYAEGATISNVHATNVNLQAEYGYTGGLIGELYLGNTNNESSIVGSSAQGAIQAGSNNVGGLVGHAYVENTKLLIEQTYTDVAINNTTSSSSADTGGLIGELYASAYDDNATAEVEIRDVYAWGDVNVPDGENVGGLIGRVQADTSWDNNQSATITIANAYAKGAVTARDEAGGLIGQLSNTDESEGASYTITNSFAMGEVTILEDGAVYQGGLVGRNETMTAERTFTNNYYDQGGTGQSVCATDDEDGDTLSCTVVNADGSQPNYFINNTSNPPLNTWNFEDIWVANQGNTPTFKPVVDEDSDGIDDTVENNAPNNGDGNNDGTPDSRQNHVASLVSPVSGKYVTLAVHESCELSDVSIASESGHSAQDQNYEYQSGFVTFTASGCDDDQTSVTLYYHDSVFDGQIARKYNPNSNTYFTITDAGITSLSGPLSGTRVSYSITDNGDLDINDEDGVITDPIGLALSSNSDTTAVGSPNTGLTGTGMARFILALGAGITLLGSRFILRKLQTRGKTA